MKYLFWSLKGVKVFKNEPSKICGRQPLKNFTRPTLEYFVPFIPQFYLNFNEHIHLDPNQSSRGLSNVWKDD